MACTTTCRPPKPSQAHCGVCHLTMATVTDFDNHRRDGQCLHPSEVGLVEVNRLWATPEGHRSRARDAAKLAEAREKRLAGTSGTTPPPTP